MATDPSAPAVTVPPTAYTWGNAFRDALHQRSSLAGLSAGPVGIGVSYLANVLRDYLQNHGQQPGTPGATPPTDHKGGLISTGIGWLLDHSNTNAGQTGQNTWNDSSWMRNGSATDPFGYLGMSGSEDFSSSLGFEDAYPPGGFGNVQSVRAASGGYQGNPYLSAPSTSQIDTGNGVMMPVISGPQWTGPKGLPWTQGADPASYPYSYIPPNGSWEGVDWFHLPGSAGGATGGDPNGTSGSPGGMFPGFDIGTAKGLRGGSMIPGSVRANDLGPGQGYTDAGAFVNGEFSNGGWDSEGGLYSGGYYY